MMHRKLPVDVSAVVSVFLYLCQLVLMYIYNPWFHIFYVRTIVSVSMS